MPHCAIVTDNAAYMVAVRNKLKLKVPKMQCLPCILHVPYLIIGDVIKSQYLETDSSKIIHLVAYFITHSFGEKN